jgi:hypothetical protein
VIRGGYRLSEKIMLQQQATAALIQSVPRGRKRPDRVII